MQRLKLRPDRLGDAIGARVDYDLVVLHTHQIGNY
jgi:hypothetical protein